MRKKQICISIQIIRSLLWIILARKVADHVKDHKLGQNLTNCLIVHLSLVRKWVLEAVPWTPPPPPPTVIHCATVTLYPTLAKSPFALHPNVGSPSYRALVINDTLTNHWGNVELGISQKKSSNYSLHYTNLNMNQIIQVAYEIIIRI